MCQTKQVELEKHLVVEAPDESGTARTIGLCHECHLKHKRYRNYLRDEYGIDIDRTSLAQE